MQTVGDTIGQIIGMVFLACAVGGFVWAFVEFITFLIRGDKKR